MSSALGGRISCSTCTPLDQPSWIQALQCIQMDRPLIWTMSVVVPVFERSRRSRTLRPEMSEVEVLTPVLAV